MVDLAITYSDIVDLAIFCTHFSMLLTHYSETGNWLKVRVLSSRVTPCTLVEVY
jgi:hypothetical protein